MWLQHKAGIYHWWAFCHNRYPVSPLKPPPDSLWKTFQGRSSSHYRPRQVLHWGQGETHPPHHLNPQLPTCFSCKILGVGCGNVIRAGESNTTVLASAGELQVGGGSAVKGAVGQMQWGNKPGFHFAKKKKKKRHQRKGFVLSHSLLLSKPLFCFNLCWN